MTGGGGEGGAFGGCPWLSILIDRQYILFLVLHVDDVDDLLQSVIVDDWLSPRLLQVKEGHLLPLSHLALGLSNMFKKGREGYVGRWVGGWVDGWLDGWMVLR